MAETKLEISSDGLEAIIAGFQRAVAEGDKLVAVAEEIGDAQSKSAQSAIRTQEEYNAGLRTTGKELKALSDIDALAGLSGTADKKLRDVAASIVEMGKKLKTIGPEGKAAFSEIIKMVVNLENVLKEGSRLQKLYFQGQQEAIGGSSQLLSAGLKATEEALGKNRDTILGLVEDISASVFSEGLPAGGLPIVQAVLQLKDELSILEEKSRALDVIGEEFEKQRAAVEGNAEAVARLAQGEQELAQLRAENNAAINANLAAQEAQGAALEALFDAEEEGQSRIADATRETWEVEQERLLTSQEVAEAQKRQTEANLAASQAAAVTASEEAQAAQERASAIRAAAEDERTRKGLIEDTTAAIKDLQAQQAKAKDDDELASVNKRLAEAKLNLKELQKLGLPEFEKASEGAKSMRTRIREANEEVSRLADEFDGKITPELVAAAEEAARLRSELGDVNAVIAALDPTAKFQAVAGLTQSVIGGFTAVSGVLALVGSNGDKATETIAKMQSLLAVLQGANAFLDGFGKGLKALNAFVIANTAVTTTNTAAKAGNAAASNAMTGANASAAASTGALTGGIRTLTAAMAANPILAAVVVLVGIATALVALGDDAQDSAEKAGQLVAKLEEIQAYSERSTNFNKRKADLEAEIKLIERGNDAYGQRGIIEEKYTNLSRKLKADIQSAFENELQLQEKINALKDSTNEDDVKALEEYEGALAASQDKRLQLNQEGQLAQLQLNRDVLAFETAEAKKAEQEAERLSKEAIARAKAEAAALLKAKQDFAKASEDLNKRLANDTRENQVTELQTAAEEAASRGQLDKAREFKDQIVGIREQQAGEELDALQRGLERKLALIELERTTSVERLKELTEEQRNALADELIDSGAVQLGADQLGQLEELRSLAAVQAERERTKNKIEETTKRIELDKREVRESIDALSAFEEFSVAAAQNEEATELDKQKKILAIRIEYAKKQIELLEATGDIADATKAEELRTALAGLEKDLAGLSKFNLKNLLGLTDEDLAVLTPIIQQAGQLIQQGLLEQIDLQRQANEQYISSLDERLAATQRALDIEAKYREDGEANNYERERAAQEELLKLKEEAIKEDERLAKKQQAIAKITQVAQLGSAVAALLASEASKGVIGIGIAAAAIPVLFALFKNAKSTAAGAASYFEGTPYLELGQNRPGRDTIPIMANRGERIVPTKDNMRDWNLYEGLRTGNTALLEQGIMEAVQRNGLDHLLEAFKPSAKMPSFDFGLPGRMQDQRTSIEQAKLSASFDPALRGILQGVEANTRAMMEEAFARVDRIALPDGTVLEFHKGGKRRVKHL